MHTFLLTVNSRVMCSFIHVLQRLPNLLDGYPGDVNKQLCVDISILFLLKSSELVL